MPSIAQCIRDIRNYTYTEEKIEIIITKLNLAIDDLSNVEREIRSSYQVNNNSAAVAERVANLKNQLLETAQFLNGTILPDIDSSRNDVQNLKEWLEEQEEDD